MRQFNRGIGDYGFAACWMPLSEGRWMVRIPVVLANQRQVLLASKPSLNPEGSLPWALRLPRFPLGAFFASWVVGCLSLNVAHLFLNSRWRGPT